MQKKKLAIVFLFILILFYLLVIVVQANSNTFLIKYKVHLKDMGWIGAVTDGAIGGTTGQSRRMEAISISLNDIDGTLSYKSHVQDYGWLNTASEGNISGTVGESKRMEAIIIKLENSSYNIKYRVHIQDYGWSSWVGSGEVAGTTGESRRIEAIQIYLEKKSSNITSESNINVTPLEKNIYSGIDVSKYQGNIDWSKVKKSGIDFAMIRCGYRGTTVGQIYEDEKFYNNITGAYKNGVKVGLYFYTSAINEKEAKEEADFVINLLKKYNVKSYVTYPVAIDIEDFEGARSFTLSQSQRTDVVKSFCDTIQNSGLKPMVYSYTYFLETKLYMDDLKNYDVWIADYYGNTWYKRDFTIWQYTDKGNINGILGDVDLNYSYRNY